MFEIGFADTDTDCLVKGRLISQPCKNLDGYYKQNTLTPMGVMSG